MELSDEETDYENQWEDPNEVKEVGVAEQPQPASFVSAAQAGEQQRDALDRLLSGLSGGGERAEACVSEGPK